MGNGIALEKNDTGMVPPVLTTKLDIFAYLVITIKYDDYCC